MRKDELRLAIENVLMEFAHDTVAFHEAVEALMKLLSEDSSG